MIAHQQENDTLKQKYLTKLKESTHSSMFDFFNHDKKVCKDLCNALLNPDIPTYQDKLSQSAQDIKKFIQKFKMEIKNSVNISTPDTNLTSPAPTSHIPLIDTNSSLPSSFIISMYATGSVLLITGILACALLNPIVAAFVGLTLTATVVNVLATVGAVGIVAGGATIFSAWCGYFKPADTHKVDQPIDEPIFSAEKMSA